MTNDQKPANGETIGNLTTYRPDIKVHDCTIRDGGLMNDHKFSHEFVKEVYDACVEGGVDYMEVGYKASKKQVDVKKFGP